MRTCYVCGFPTPAAPRYCGSIVCTGCVDAHLEDCDECQWEYWTEKAVDSAIAAANDREMEEK